MIPYPLNLKFLFLLVKTFKKRQSSDPEKTLLFEGWAQEEPKSVVILIPFHFGAGCGFFHLCAEA